MTTTKVPASLPVPNFKQLQKRIQKESGSLSAPSSQGKNTIGKNKEEIAQLDRKITKVEQEIKRAQRSF